MLGEKALGYLIVTAKADKKVTDTDVRLLEHLSPMVASMLFAVQVAADIRAR
jgi:hypothetical protein